MVEVELAREQYVKWTQKYDKERYYCIGNKLAKAILQSYTVTLMHKWSVGLASASKVLNPGQSPIST